MVSVELFLFIALIVFIFFGFYFTIIQKTKKKIDEGKLAFEKRGFSLSSFFLSAKEVIGFSFLLVGFLGIFAFFYNGDFLFAFLILIYSIIVYLICVSYGRHGRRRI